VESKKKFAVVEVGELQWPATLEVPSRRFRLHVAADVRDANRQAISDFAFSALTRGMVYFCSWGPGCERFHDIVDEVILGDDIGEQRFAGPSSSDVIMTTSHAKESLEEAIDFFLTCAVPTDGFAADSEFRLLICVANKEWAAQANSLLQSARFFV
jgi:hypothetical protein